MQYLKNPRKFCQTFFDFDNVEEGDASNTAIPRHYQYIYRRKAMHITCQHHPELDKTTQQEEYWMIEQGEKKNPHRSTDEK